MATYFGFAISDSMFSGDVTIHRRGLTPNEAKEIVRHGVISCLNPSHRATIDVMEKKYGIHVEIPPAPPSVELKPGDTLIVMAVRGLPRLTDRHEYNQEEIEKAQITFSEYFVEEHYQSKPE